MCVGDSGRVGAVRVGDSGRVGAVRVGDSGRVGAVCVGDSGRVGAVRVGDSGRVGAVRVGDSGRVGAVCVGDSGRVGAVRVGDSGCEIKRRSRDATIGLYAGIGGQTTAPGVCRLPPTPVALVGLRMRVGAVRVGDSGCENPVGKFKSPPKNFVVNYPPQIGVFTLRIIAMYLPSWVTIAPRF